MNEAKDINRICRSYIAQSVLLTIVMSAVIVAVSHLASVASLKTSMIVGAAFTLVVEFADAFIWRKVRLTSEESLPSFFTAVSGFRLLLAVATITVCYFALGKPDMFKFCMVFMAYYIALIAHHSLFFSHVANPRNRCDKENN